MSMNSGADLTVVNPFRMDVLPDDVLIQVRPITFKGLDFLQIRHSVGDQLDIFRAVSTVL